jgi:hypothetical protein
MTPATFTPTEPHPVLQLPTASEAALMGSEVWIQAMAKREEAIAGEIRSPLYRCWEPPIWRVCDALLGLVWPKEEKAREAAESVNEAIRQNLGFKRPVSVLYLLGAQRSSKTEYAMNRMSRITQRTDDGLSWLFHNTLNASIDSHQKLIWKYLPPSLKGKTIATQTTYIAYKDKTGFSDGSLVLPNLHKLRFLSYEIDIEDLQGQNLDAAAADEFVTPEHVDTLKARVSVKNGFVIVMLAPIMGYTPLVQSASDGATIVRESIAFMNPADGGPKSIHDYLGLTEAETGVLRDWLGRKMRPPFPNVPFSRPEDCSKWLLGQSGQPPIPPGRKFKMIPRIQKPADPEERSAIVHFHGNDNPYGNPLSLALLNAAAPEEQSNRIFYGVAKQGIARVFPRFDPKVHVIPDEAIPKVGQNYMWEDPVLARNPFRTWIRVCPKAWYIYREWPGSYEIPGVGVPGLWALPHGRLRDGAPGPAQDSFGFGLMDLKAELARLEGWKDFDKPMPPTMTERDWKKGWSNDNGAREIVGRRFIDSRFASTPHIENDRPTTLLENYADIGLFFELTSGADLKEGIALINDKLSYDPMRPIDALNCPRLFIAASCKNTIFAFQTWRNADGNKSATKDPIDNVRYAVLQGVEYASAEDFRSEGGGSY